ncbi:hypothetical protein C1M51_02730 [Methylibium sp. Pch-M]|uniref:lysozyme n=1 Tax=Methylibium sp. Pch-M TaxID=2082386 RepID=UPI00101069EB|nr:lysozyme [Methylibium sp. Pch-M]QAZ38420.1 hypothetical protein C1M51_02730 [Methylibium sp. Pch-M]
MDWPINQAGVELLKQWEGCRLTAYQDIVGVWTIGWGRTTDVQEGDTCTQEQADEWLREELVGFRDAVLKACTKPPTPNELSALTVFAYNVGVRAMTQSTALRRHNNGDPEGCIEAMKWFNMAGGRVVKGLIARRHAEAVLYQA